MYWPIAVPKASSERNRKEATRYRVRANLLGVLVFIVGFIGVNVTCMA
jgi:hypothetical protein